MLYTKYRPQKFSSVVGQDEITNILKNQIRRDSPGHSYLFAGPSGTGKTSTARILARALNCETPRAGEPCLKCKACEASQPWDQKEMDAATFRGIDGIRDLQMWQMYSPFGKRKILIIDEAHGLTTPAWDALLRILEEPAGKLVTILCTTQPESVPETVRSRCQMFTFKEIGKKDMFDNLQAVCRKEHVNLSQQAIRFISSMAGGNMRTALTMTDQVVNLGKAPNVTQVKRFIQGALVK